MLATPNCYLQIMCDKGMVEVNACVMGALQEKQWLNLNGSTGKDWFTEVTYELVLQG